ncbi:helix-turn-helix domain-containing protein [Nesterenkonia halotolerans]|uniref:Chromosome segregation ATPase n=1 Tax=Nesterenkonia halotolerans TaxID=225325 RepID=A0ABR9JAM2_9MICC|nr:helix-turn-helix domain-containing protein [Nesterenkonia halotolerans]MBE1515950.1 chromosome segregation ATPase [Nesterenkonia halotolerans]
MHDEFMGESLTVAETVAQFEVSMSTVRRHLRDGKFPNSTKQMGKVYIPMTDLESVGIQRRESQNVSDSASDSGRLSALSEQLREAEVENYQLRTELSAERVKTQALDKLAQSEHSRITDLQRHVSSLEATVSEQRESLAQLRERTKQIEGPEQSVKHTESVESVRETAPKRSRWRRWLGA